MFPVYISLTRAHSLSFYAMCSLFHHKAPNESKPMHRPVMKFEAACKMHFKVRTHSWKICVNNPPCLLWFLINSFWHLRRQTVEHYAHFLFFFISLFSFLYCLLMDIPWAEITPAFQQWHLNIYSNLPLSYWAHLWKLTTIKPLSWKKCVRFQVCQKIRVNLSRF